jgi:hypothetical protein
LIAELLVDGTCSRRVDGTDEGERPRTGAGRFGRPLPEARVLHEAMVIELEKAGKSDLTFGDDTLVGRDE